MATVNTLIQNPTDVSGYKQTKLPFCSAPKVWLAVSAIFLAAGFATIGYCAAVGNIHAATGAGVSVAGLIGFIPAIRFLSRPDSDIDIGLKPNQKIISHGVTFACVGEGNGLQTFQLSIDRFDFQDFKTWLLQKAPPEKVTIFQQTLLEDPTVLGLSDKPLSMTYHRMTDSCDLNAKKPETAQQQVQCTPDWYDFKDEGATYIGFANSSNLGGEWREGGNAQEETLFAQSLELALLGYLSGMAEITPAPSHGIPFSVPSVQMRHKVPHHYYGTKGLQRVDISNFETEDFENQRPVTITGMTAKCWTRQGAYYGERHLTRMFQAAYRACLTEKRLHPNHPVVHTGAWGCGGFNNSAKTIVVLQMYAAKMAGVDLVFHGVGQSDLNPNYSEHFIKGEAEQVVQKASTPQELFDAIIRKQTSEEWRSKNSKVSKAPKKAKE